MWGTEDLIKDKVVIESSQYDVDGKPIGFPVETGTYGFFYNQKLADELGITEMPKNYEEFIALGERFLTEFKDTGIAYIAYPGKNALGYLTNQWMQPLLCEQDPDGFLDAFGMKPGAWSSDWVKDCYKKILALRKYEMEGCIGLTHTEAQIAWLQGDAFLMPNGTWLEGEMLADTPDDFEMKMFAYPTMESEHDNISYVYVDSNMLIPKDAKNKDAAYEFIRFMYQDEWQQRYAELAKTNPGTKVSLEGVETSPMVASVADMISDPNSKIAQPKVGGYPVFRTEPKNWYKQNEMSMWLGEISVDEFFDTFEQKCEEDRQAEDFQELENYWIVSPE